MKTLKPTIQHLISEGRTEEAIEKFMAAMAETNPHLYNKLILLSAQFEHIETLETSGTHSAEEISRMTNQVNHNLMKLLDDADKKPLPPFLPALRNTFQSSLLLLGLATVLIAGTIWGITSFFNAPAPETVPAKPTTTTYNDALVDSLYDISSGSLYADFQNTYLNPISQAKKDQILVKADDICERLKDEDDSSITLTSRLERDLCLMVLYKIRSLLSDGKEKQIKYADKAIKYGIKANDLIVQLDTLTEEKKILARWVVEEQHGLRIKINIFIAKCSLCAAGGECNLALLSKDLANLREPLTEYNYFAYPILKKMKELYSPDFTF